MISALPGVLAARLAGEVTQAAGTTGLFTEPCRGLEGEVAFTGAEASRAAVFVRLGDLEQDSEIGARSEGEAIVLPFVAEVHLALAGPETVALGVARRDPSGAEVAGADLMLSVVSDVLGAAQDAGQGAPLSEAVLRAGERRIDALWRYGQTLSIAPDIVSGRRIWRLKIRLEGRQTLSPLPAEGIHILRAELSGTVAGKPLEATVQSTSAQLPLSVFLGLGPEHATRLASYGLRRLGDLMRIPRGEIGAQATEIAEGDTDLRQALTVLHAVAMLRLDAVQGGLNAGLLFERHAALTLDQVWDGVTLTLPADMREDQRLRVRFMAEHLLTLIRPEARAQVTLGQLATLDSEVE